MEWCRVRSRVDELGAIRENPVDDGPKRVWSDISNERMHEYIGFEIWGEPILKPAQRGSNRWPSSSQWFIVQGSRRRQQAEISHRHAMQEPTGDARLTSAHQGALRT
jgi:hypothetical protein